MHEWVEQVLQHRKASQHLRVLEIARRLQEERPLLTAGEWCEVYEAAGLAAWALRDHFQAVQWAERCYDAARESDLSARLAVAAYYRGTYWTIIGDNVQARQYLLEFLSHDDPHRENLARYRGPAWFNLGTVHMRRQRYEDASEAFSHASMAFEASGQPLRVIDTQLQMAWMWTLTGRLDLAGDLLRITGEALIETPDEDLAASRLCHSAFLMQRCGELHQALQLCEEVMAPGRSGITDHHISEAAWIAGECALTLGQISEAATMASVAQEHAIRANWPALMNRAGDLRRRVIEAGEQPA